MPEHFKYMFDREHPIELDMTDGQQQAERKTLEDIGVLASETIAAIPEFQALPEVNQQMMLMMSRIAIFDANRATNPKLGLSRDNNFWALYIIGSRARHEETESSDLDLLSVGTFFRHQGFLRREKPKLGELGSEGSPDVNIFDGYDAIYPAKLPTRYNVGAVNRKYMVRATPKSGHQGIPVDLSVVDFSFPPHNEITLTTFLEDMDVCKRVVDGPDITIPLPKVPIFELRSEQFSP
ncbi:MAG TPA: hypothetical protein VIH90_06385 [Candidatus Saccharimonadales bacterium]